MQPTVSTRQRRIGGAICLLLVIATWVIQAQLLHSIGDDGAWSPPYQISFWIHAVWIVGVPLALVIRAVNTSTLPPLPWKRLVLFGAIMAPVLVLGAMCWYISLRMTTVSINTAVYNSSFVMVFLFSIVLLRESVTLARVGGTLLCVGGLALIAVGSLHGSGNGGGGAASKDTVWGYVFLLFSMLGYAIYTVCWARLLIPVSAPFARTPILGLAGLGAIGAWTCAILWLGIVIGNATGLEPFQWPYGSGLKTLLISMSCDVVLNAALLIGALLSSPVFMAVGSLLVIPVSVVVQFIFGGTLMGWMEGVGVVLIVLGCVAFEVGDAIVKCVRHRDTDSTLAESAAINPEGEQKAA